MENEEPVTEEEFMEAFQRLPEYLREYWKKYVLKSHGQEFGYTVGYIVGMIFVQDTVVKPHLDRMDKILYGKGSVE